MATTAQAAALIDRLMPAVEAGMHAADDLTLAHEAERLEAQQASPVITRLRLIVAAEQRQRASREVAREAFRSRRPAMAFRCCVGLGSEVHCSGAVRIGADETHSWCSSCGAEHDRDMRLTLTRPVSSDGAA